MKNVLILICVLSLTLSSCSKEKSNKWVVIDLNVVSEFTGEPIEADLKLEYYYQTMDGASATPIDRTGNIVLGTTIGGYYYVEEDVSDISHNLYLIVTPSDRDFYPDDLENFFYLKKVRVYRFNKNVLTVEIGQSRYPFKINLKNTSCYDETDTVWVTNKFDQPIGTYTGCWDGYLSEDVVYQHGNEIAFKLRSKKNGVIADFEVNHILQPGVFNEILIEY
ncbi:MAG: hypothetical protein ACI8ZM_003042 [Crocinitomix sp.]|jgi:hypothetical protein